MEIGSPATVETNEGSLEPFLGAAIVEPITKGLHPRRWWLLLLLTTASMASGVVWITWTPLASVVQHDPFNWPGWLVPLLAACGPLMCLFAPWCLPKIVRDHGLRNCIVIASALTFIGAIFRVVPLDEGSIGYKLLVFAGTTVAALMV